VPADEPGHWPDEKALAIGLALTRAGISHAFGGGIALIYAGEPRGTVDIDVNVFLKDSVPEAALEVMRGLGIPFDSAHVVAETRKTGQVRLDWNGTFVDLFLSYAPFHDAAEQRTRAVPLPGGTIRILSPEDLVVFKVMFNRKKDWLDIEQLLYVQGSRFDLDYAVGWLESMLGAEDATIARLKELAHEAREWAASEPGGQ
jgi:hypothetical protein